MGRAKADSLAQIRASERLADLRIRLDRALGNPGGPYQPQSRVAPPFSWMIRSERRQMVKDWMWLAAEAPHRRTRPVSRVNQ